MVARGLRRTAALLGVLSAAALPGACAVEDFIPSEGTLSAPIVLQIGLARVGRVSGLPGTDSSFYRFTADATRRFTIALSGNSQDLGWFLYTDPGFFTQIDLCNQHRYNPAWESCATLPTLAAGVTYYLEVHNFSFTGDVYSLLVN